MEVAANTICGTRHIPHQVNQGHPSPADWHTCGQWHYTNSHKIPTTCGLQ
jgi:hypothetical protein